MATKKFSKKSKAAPSKTTTEGCEKIFRKLMRQTKPYLTAAEVEVANKMAPLDPTRRLALAMLARPFSMLVKNCRKSRKFAVSIAGIERCLKRHVDGYLELARLMEMSGIRIAMAVCVRQDSEDVFKEGEKVVVSHDDQ